jgi:hypothetical protein
LGKNPSKIDVLKNDSILIRLSKKSKCGIFTIFGCNKIKYLQTMKSPDKDKIVLYAIGAFQKKYSDFS